MLELLYFSQLWMALSATAFLYVNARLLGSRLPAVIYLASCSATWAIYLWDSERGAWQEDAVTQPRRAAWFRRHSKSVHLAAPLLMAVALVAVVSQLKRWGTLALAAFLFVSGMAYVFAIIPHRSGFRRLKDIPMTKALVITVAWWLGGWGLPLLLRRFMLRPAWGSVFWLAVVDFSLLFWDTLALDVRDAPADARHEVLTLATRLGPKAKRLLVLGAALTLIPSALVGTAGAHPLRAGLVVSSMSLSFLVGALVVRSPRSEGSFGVLVSLWRFAGAAVLWLLSPG